MCDLERKFPSQEGLRAPGYWGTSYTPAGWDFLCPLLQTQVGSCNLCILAGVTEGTLSLPQAEREGAGRGRRENERKVAVNGAGNVLP